MDRHESGLFPIPSHQNITPKPVPGIPPVDITDKVSDLEQLLRTCMQCSRPTLKLTNQRFIIAQFLLNAKCKIYDILTLDAGCNKNIMGYTVGWWRHGVSQDRNELAMNYTAFG